MKLNWQGVILQGHIQNPPSFKSKNEIQIQEPLTQLTGVTVIVKMNIKQFDK